MHVHLVLIADLCLEKGIDFALGHALYMKAIHGGKTKNDKIDSRKIADLFRGGMFPPAYLCPKEMRSVRDLLRRRNHFMLKSVNQRRNLTIFNFEYCPLYSMETVSFPLKSIYIKWLTVFKEGRYLCQ